MAALVGALAIGCGPPGSERAAARREALQAPVVWGGEKKIVASDGNIYDYFGMRVALTDERAIVGAFGDDLSSGAAYVFRRSGDDWIEEQKLIASDRMQDDAFGCAVALTRDRALVAAVADDGYRGSAYVFVRNGTTWTEEQKLVADDGVSNDDFGESVSLTDDRALVGAFADDGQRGAAYVFVRNGSTWMQERKLVASDGVAADGYGREVSLTDDRAIVGSPSHGFSQGAAYVYRRSGTTWTEEQKLVASDGAAQDLFGWKVALTVDRALVGAYRDDSRRGAAYVFSRNATTWTEEQRLVASERAVDNDFGIAVTLTADRALVGTVGEAGRRGSATMFVRSGTTWSEEQKLMASDGVALDYFGGTVAMTADRVLIGAIYDEGRRGAAYAYRLGGSGGAGGAAGAGGVGGLAGSGGVSGSGGAAGSSGGAGVSGAAGVGGVAGASGTGGAGGSAGIGEAGAGGEGTAGEGTAGEGTGGGGNGGVATGGSTTGGRTTGGTPSGGSATGASAGSLAGASGAGNAGGGNGRRSSTSDDDSGCGCRTRSRHSSSATWLAALGSVLAFARRRRKL